MKQVSVELIDEQDSVAVDIETTSEQQCALHIIVAKSVIDINAGDILWNRLRRL